MTPLAACPDFDQLALLAENALDEDQSSRLRSHVESCPRCSTTLGSIAEHASFERRVARAMGRSAVEPGGQAFAPAGFADLREIGRGGMGIVYAARQLAPPRMVALKVMRGLNALDEHSLHLFQREIRALARLSHPHIAALHDAGRLPSGEPFLVMELARGAPLGAWVRAYQPALEARLMVFIKIAQAVQAAHERGVVHRDLKPSNVLVDDHGEPKVLDFGLAKIAGDEGASIMTEAGSVRGTLPYMSPEQAGGDPAAIDSRSDVYSLGVILYELLTGVLPIEVRDVALPEAARRIHEIVPAAPSTHDRRLRGDLDTIVLKALSKDRSQRYASAAALSEDIERHLRDEVILARPVSGTYLLRKAIARNRVPAALLALLMVVSIVAALWLARLHARGEVLRGDAERAAVAANAARDDALRSEARSRLEARTKSRVSDVLVYLLQRAAADDGGDQVRVVDILPRVENTMRAELEREPEIASVLGMVLGELRSATGQYEDAEAMYRFAIEHEPVDERVDWDAVRMRGNLARLLIERGRLDEGERLLDQADELARRIEEPLEMHRIELRERRAVVWSRRGQAERAAAEYRSLIHEYGAQPSHTDDGLGGLYGGLCVSLRAMNDLTGAFEAAQAEYDCYSRAFGPEHTRTNVARMNKASILQARGDVQAALDEYSEIASHHARQLGPEHHYTLMALHNVGSAWVWLDQDGCALEVLEPLLEIERRKLGPSARTTLETLNLVTSAQYRLKRFAQAEASAREFYAAVNAVLEPPHDLWLRARFNLGRTLYTRKQYEESEKVLLEGWSALEQNGLSRHPQRSAFARFLTTLYDKLGREEDADMFRRYVKG